MHHRWSKFGLADLSCPLHRQIQCVPNDLSCQLQSRSFVQVRGSTSIIRASQKRSPAISCPPTLVASLQPASFESWNQNCGFGTAGHRARGVVGGLRSGSAGGALGELALAKTCNVSLVFRWWLRLHHDYWRSRRASEREWTDYGCQRFVCSRWRGPRTARLDAAQESMSTAATAVEFLPPLQQQQPPTSSS